PYPAPRDYLHLHSFPTRRSSDLRHYLEQWHADFNDEAQAKAEEEGYTTWVEAFEFHRAGQLSDSQLDPNLPVLKPWVLESIDELDRKSTRLNSSHVKISYAVFCL